MGATVLVCDAADEVAYLQYHLLREAPDLVVDVTSDPFRAVEAAARARPDVITVDLGLEGLGGAELIRRLCASTPGTRVIARSSSREPSAVADALAAGAAGYVVREDGPDALLAAVRAALTGAAVLSPVVATAFGVEVMRLVVVRARARRRARRRPILRHAGNVGEGRLPREHLPRTPDAGDRRQGHRLRAAQPGGARRRARSVPRAAPGLTRQADGDRGRDHHDRGARTRHLRARDHPDGPRTADPTCGRRGRARVSRHADRRPAARRAAGDRRRRSHRRGRSGAPRQRLPVLSRRIAASSSSPACWTRASSSS